MDDRRKSAPSAFSPMRLLWAMVVIGLPVARSFNADLATAVQYSGPVGSEFGISLSFHSSGANKMLLVGAPRDNYTNPAWTAGGTLQRTGVLYQCPWSPTSSATCQQLQVDTVAPRQGATPEVKSGMRMGQSVLSVGPDNLVMVCASRYGKSLLCQANYDPTITGQCYGNPSNATLYNNLGKCVILPSNLQVNGTPTDFAPVDVVFPYSPSTLDLYLASNHFRSAVLKNRGFGGLNTPSFGLTIAAQPKNLTHRFPRDQVDVHGPTILHSRGQVVHADLSSGTPTGVTQQIINTYPASDAGGALATAEGDFDGTGKPKLAWGRPFLDYTPSVVCFRNCQDASQGDVWIIDGSLGNSDFYNALYPASAYGVLESNQFAEGFGMSLLAEDTNNDGIHELLVGAPNYMDYSRANEPNGYDFGIVYIYSSKLQTFLKNRTAASYLYFNEQKNGPSPNLLREYDMSLAGAPASRFGSSIASVGDVDRDGYPDVAIGAPGEILSSGASGAVYIYLGSSSGLSKTAAQRITPSDVNTRGFGYSLAYGWDIDDNGYSDIAVGALESSNAFLFRSRPVITVQLQFNVVSDIDATNRSCLFVAGQYRACFMAQVCAQYQRPILPTNVVISYTLSVDDSSFELKLGTTSISEMTTQMTVGMPGLLQCETHTVFVKTTVPDLCKPANVSLTKWSLVDRLSTPTDLAPILAKDQAAPTPIGRAVRLVPICSGSSCNPDLVTSFPGSQVTVTSGIGSSAPVSLAIRNAGTHPACSATVVLHLSQPGVVFQSVDENLWLCSERGLQVLRCQPAAQNRHYGAIGPGTTATFNATLYSGKTPFRGEVISFTLNATAISGNAEVNTTNNPSRRSVDVRRRSTLGVKIADELDLAIALTEGFRSAASPSKLQDIPLDLISIFQLSNHGPSPATVTDLAIKYPLESAGTKEKQSIYYLTAIEASLADVRCNSSALVNANGFDLSSDFVLNFTTKFHPVLPSPVASQSPQTAYKECSASVCSVAIVCTVPVLDVNTAVQVRLRWRVYTTYIQSLLVERSRVPLSVSSSIVGTAPGSLYSATLSPQMATRSTEFTVPQAQTPEATNSGIIAGVVVGCIVFILLVFLVLFKSGFFNRKKPEEMQDGRAHGVAWKSAEAESVSPAAPTEDEYEEVRSV